MTQGRIGYLISQYPAPSHTFIRREVAALRAQGFTISTYSIQKPPERMNAEFDEIAARETFVILAKPILRYIFVHLAAIFQHPIRYIHTFRLALQHRVPGLRALIWAIFHFTEGILLAYQLRKDNIEHVHSHFANSGATVGMLASKFAGMTWSLTLHGISEFDYPAGVLLPKKINAARFVACVSRFGMAQAMRYTAPAQWDKFSLVRCGIDRKLLPARQPRPQDGRLRLICVGRLSPEKGQAGLIDAVAILRDRRVATSLMLVGDGPQLAELRAWAGVSGVSDIVNFVGRVDEVKALQKISDADILVVPSFMEGLPVVLMEAMAIGIPVIAARVAGIPELVKDGETGLCFDPADWLGLADAIARLATDPAMRCRLATAGQQRVADEFEVDDAVIPLATRFRSLSR